MTQTLQRNSTVASHNPTCQHTHTTHAEKACDEPCGQRHQICDDCNYPIGICYFKADEILYGNVRNKLRAFFNNGKKQGIREEQARMLQILEFYQMIWWDEAQQVWLDMKTGKAIYGLDWRESLNK
jgi:hypothetical protein